MDLDQSIDKHLNFDEVFLNSFNSEINSRAQKTNNELKFKNQNINNQLNLKEILIW